jgi:hypothetical protein
MQRSQHQSPRPVQQPPPVSGLPRQTRPLPDEQWRWQMGRDVWLAKEAHQVSLGAWAVGLLVTIVAVLLLGMYLYAGVLWLREMVGF